MDAPGITATLMPTHFCGYCCVCLRGNACVCVCVCVREREKCLFSGRLFIGLKSNELFYSVRYLDCKLIPKKWKCPPKKTTRSSRLTLKLRTFWKQLSKVLLLCTVSNESSMFTLILNHTENSLALFKMYFSIFSSWRLVFLFNCMKKSEK